MRASTFRRLMADPCCWPARVAAQEQRGSIEGVVKDASGAVLPGVTVEAQAPNGRIAVDDDRRQWRLPFPVARAR